MFPESMNLAGKTGTTDELRDSWFAGFSGNLLAVTWIGRDDNKPINLTGSKGALRLWADTMKRLPLQSLEPLEPGAVEQILIDPRSGYLANNSCRGARWVPFVSGSEPDTFAPCATGRPYSTQSKGNAVDSRDNSESMGTFFKRLLE